MVHCCRRLRVEGWPPELTGDGKGMKHDQHLWRLNKNMDHIKCLWIKVSLLNIAKSRQRNLQ